MLSDDGAVSHQADVSRRRDACRVDVGVPPRRRGGRPSNTTWQTVRRCQASDGGVRPEHTCRARRRGVALAPMAARLGRSGCHCGHGRGAVGRPSRKTPVHVVSRRWQRPRNRWHERHRRPLHLLRLRRQRPSLNAARAAAAAPPPTTTVRDREGCRHLAGHAPASGRRARGCCAGNRSTQRGRCGCRHQPPPR